MEGATQPTPASVTRTVITGDAAAPDDNQLSSNTALPCAQSSPPQPLPPPGLNGQRCSCSAAAAGTRSGSSQPAATGSPLPGPGLLVMKKEGHRMWRAQHRRRL